MELNWDISKCFEHVQKEQLNYLAVALGYPLTVLHLSLANYAWLRRLRGTVGMVTQQIGASRGIVAGLAFACYELIAYMYAATRCVLRCGVYLSVHVDDLAMTYTHFRARQSLRTFQRAAAVMVVEFEQQLGVPF